MKESDLPGIRPLPEGVIKDWRKKPVVIQAVQWNGTMYIADFLHQWSRGDVYFDDGLWCKTLEGDLSASLGDYIICGVAGEFYACKENIFLQTYDLAHDKARY